MSQHNIIGSEAFDRKPFVLVRSFRAGAMRRRRASTTLAYMIVAVLALAAGAVAAAIALAPQLADAQSAESSPITAVGPGLPLTPPIVPGSSQAASPQANEATASPAA